MVNLSPLVYAATALLSFADATPLIARTPTHHNTSPKAVFFQTNKSPNSIVALPVVDEDGKLGDAVFHPAGGNGAAEVSASGGVNTPDSLGSQDSVVVEGNVCRSILSYLRGYRYILLTTCSTSSPSMPAQTKCPSSPSPLSTRRTCLSSARILHQATSPSRWP